MTQPELEPRPLDPESIAQTIRPLSFPWQETTEQGNTCHNTVKCFATKMQEQLCRICPTPLPPPHSTPNTRTLHLYQHTSYDALLLLNQKEHEKYDETGRSVKREYEQT